MSSFESGRARTGGQLQRSSPFGISYAAQRRRTQRRLLLVALLFLLLAGVSRALEAQLGDLHYVALVRGAWITSEGPRQVWELLSAFGGRGLAPLVLLALLSVRCPRSVQLLVLGTVVAGVGANTAKLAFGRLRPDGYDLAWPSGHTAGSFAFALTFVIALRGRRPWLTLALCAFALLVGASRIALLRHWPSDVFGGAAVACCVVALVLRLPPRLRLLRWLPPRAILALVAVWASYLLVRAIAGRHPFDVRNAAELTAVALPLLYCMVSCFDVPREDGGRTPCRT